MIIKDLGDLKLIDKKVVCICPQDKSKCDCLTICPIELSEDCPDKSNPAKCCQGCKASEEENEDE